MIRKALIILLIFNTGCSFVMGRGGVKQKRVPNGKIALVLGGGLSRAYSEIGVLRVLEREEIPISVIIGTETGALIGAFYAAQKSTFDLEWKLFHLKESDWFDDSVFGRQNSIMAGKGLTNFINEQLIVRDLEDLNPKVVVITTDLKSGDALAFDSGSSAELITASMSIPGLYPPVNYHGRELIAGSVSAGLVPLEEAIGRNVDLIIAVDPIGNYSFSETKTLRDVITQSYLKTSRALTPKGIETPVILITPNIHGISPFDADSRKEAMIAGMRATEALLPAIRKAISNIRQ